MLARQALCIAQEQLSAVNVCDAKREAWLICAYLCAVEPGQLALFMERNLDEALLNCLLARRIAGEPLQYVLGEAGFMGLTFAVGTGVLIPRPDTEVLVEKAIFLLKEEKTLQLADIGTGSGAIAVSLAYYLPQAQVYGVDISPLALFWAKMNALRYKISEHCHLYEGDMFAPLIAQDLRFDMIISNPPYLSAADMMQLAPELFREPAIALDGGTDGLDYYRRLAQEAGLLLNSDGKLLLEHGWQQQQQVELLLRQNGWLIRERINDYGGRARGLLAVLEK